MPNAPISARTAPDADVIVIGEALIDVVASADGTVEHPGGSPANVAYGLGRLGISTALLTSIGDDERGRAIEGHLGRAGVTLLPGSKHPGRTASATATLAADGSATYDFDIAWELQPVAPAFLPKVIHTGSIATFLSPGAAAVRSLLEQAHRECAITYDPNIRPALLGSHAEATALFEEVTARILQLGAGLAVITRGSEGSLLATAATQLHVPSVKSVVADTIGAGDSYMAALIYGLLSRGVDGLLPEVLESLGSTASKAAAITVRRAGANPPTVEELLAGLEEFVPAASGLS
jgi:fructokinase